MRDCDLTANGKLIRADSQECEKQVYSQHCEIALQHERFSKELPTKIIKYMVVQTSIQEGKYLDLLFQS